MARLIVEAIVVGLMTGLIGFIISTLFMVVFSKNFSFKKYDFWPQVLLSFFITGILIHLICEFLGINKWYCKNGNSCKQN